MKTVWDQKRILEILESFHQITGIRVGLFSKDGRELLAYPTYSAPFCHTIRSTSSGLTACKECDRLAYCRASASEKTLIYHCHAGLTEMIIPIFGYSSVLGYLMLGQFRSWQLTDSEKEQLKKNWSALGLSSSDVLLRYEQMPLLTDVYVKSCACILQACASFVWTDECVLYFGDPLGKQIEDYLRTHLDHRHTIPELTELFHVGKTSLCHALKNSTGKTFSQLLQYLRIEEAKKLLSENPSMQICEISRLVGIDDYNYFTKVFRRETGITPSQYRQSTDFE